MGAPFQKFQCFVQDVGQKIHNLNADTLKILLTNTAPDAVNNKVKADLTEIAAQNGYSAGGAAVPTTAYTQTGGVGKLTGANVVFTAVGGSFGPYRYAVLYNSTPAAGNLIGWYDYGSSLSTNTGDLFTVTIDAVNGILQLA